MTKATFIPAEAEVDLSSLCTGALVKDRQERIFILIRKPGCGETSRELVRLSAPCGYYEAEALAPFTLYQGVVTLENDE